MIAGRIFRRIFEPLQKDGQFRTIYNDGIYERFMVVDKTRLNRLRWTHYLIHTSAEDLAQKVYKDNIHIRKEDMTDPTSDGAMP